jgi:hypothetical protein
MVNPLPSSFVRLLFLLFLAEFPARNPKSKVPRPGEHCQDILYAQSASFFCDIHRGSLPVEKKEGLQAKHGFALQNLRASGPCRSALSRWTAAQ